MERHSPHTFLHGDIVKDESGIRRAIERSAHWDTDTDFPYPLEGAGRLVVEGVHTLHGLVDARLPPILATFVLTQWMELAAGTLIQSYLPEGYVTLGTVFSVEHRAPALAGEAVEIRTRLVSVAGRTLEFEVVATTSAGLVARAEHQRKIVNASAMTRHAERRAKSQVG